jgi:CRISPR/Cas system-associated endonuclease Cas1
LADDASFCLRFAKGLIEGKLRNARTMLRRNWKTEGGAPRSAAGIPERGRQKDPSRGRSTRVAGRRGQRCGALFRRTLQSHQAAG